MTSTIQFPATVIGLMSGTSADGVDAAILRTDGCEIVEAGESLFLPYSDGLRAQILGLMRGEGDEVAIARALTDVHIEAVRALLKQSNQKIDLIGFHGQTIRHAPHDGITVQIGEPARMARELGIPVVADFRTNDVKHGGQGAPLVPLYHAARAAHLEKPVMVVNIGGVGNVTWIGESGAAGDASPLAGEATRLAPTGDTIDLLCPQWGLSRSGEGASTSECNLTAPPSQPSPARGEGALAAPPLPNIIAFDSGPGNALIDDWVHRHTGKRYDADGELASRGLSDGDVVREFLRDPYFLKDAPKSLDRNQFDGILARFKHLSPEDGAATLTTMTVATIALANGAVPQIPKQMIITGGGRRNRLMMQLLTQSVTMPVLPVEAVGWDGDMLEAQAFAYLAARSVLGLPLSLPTTTGVKKPCTGGTLYLS